MSDGSAFELPAIADGDVRWAAELLGLPRFAFCGTDGSDPRQSVIQCAESMDVAACPGSGKTTVLVAKLAILAAKWTWRTRGMCVLSHTNAARSEIERRLGSTSVGQRLLSYPHFIGTIHGFLNEFLALPWLRSKGYPIRVIDNSICQERVWRKLGPKWRYALQKAHTGKADVVILDARFTPGKRHGGLPCSEATATYKELQRALEETAREGYFRHDDSLVWANDLIDSHGEIVHILRDRFPVLFVDEAQDNSESQSAVLNRIFGGGGDRVIRLRFGDTNQAVFDSFHGEDASTDLFPIPDYRHELPSSHRFGQCIANLANSFGIQPYESGFEGHGPCTFRECIGKECPHTVFLFRQDHATAVLDAYAQLLVDTFPEPVLRAGRFTAVSQVHNSPEDELDHKKPYCVGDYWLQYDATTPHASATPRTLAQYVLCGVSAAEDAGGTSPAVEKIAEGLLRLAGMATQEPSFRSRRYCHRYIRSLLAESEGVLGKYLDIVQAFAVERMSIDQASWESKWKEQARAVAQALARAPVSGDEAERFLAWDAPPCGTPNAPGLQRRANVYCFPRDNPKVEIEVGSIHSVKGQTHTATLVMESFWYEHNLESLREWILDPSREWEERDGVRKKTRLKLHYVAVTRPTHLLCLAMKRSGFEDDRGNLDSVRIRALEKRGWRVVEL